MIEDDNKIIRSLYEDKITGQISQETFFMLIQKYENQKKTYEKEIQKYKKVEIEENTIKKLNKDEWEKIMKEIFEFKEINQESKSLLFKLIDKIIIDDKDIIIKYKFNISV